MNRILVVEDEPAMVMGLRDNLEFEGYHVETVTDGQIGYELIMQRKFDLILLDVMLPNMSGFDICKQVRNQNNRTPIILLTAKGDEIDKVLGLELGADDYITKPFSLRELLARIKAVLRRGGNTIATEDKNIQIGRLKLNLLSYTAHENDKEVKMTYREFEVLKYLWDHQNEIVSRYDLLDNIWGYEDEQPTTRTIDNFIVKLRNKIEANAANPKIILTVHGIGYKMLIRR
ncbi:DNA-binding response OmpR family regulator [Catalinimonas alkaloidigena]|uniref:response regulator transcription factor n=1 Tax=Catalinimonas alkaloidigena TaxID=1075417 RepID=UPI0024050C6D|nr:response regulator transcription factor [Catalinimonas alkaloidigena]MDF9797491.1 DNA-binding response OmpR family regulator [Catalinimonas alkaloidigena]